VTEVTTYDQEDQLVDQALSGGCDTHAPGTSTAASDRPKVIGVIVSVDHSVSTVGGYNTHFQKIYDRGVRICSFEPSKNRVLSAASP
jgi:hypothetical protein